MPENNNQQQGGSGFGMGLVIGALAGLGAYYLFGTEEGKETREKCLKEFHKAKKDLEKNEEFQQALGELQTAAEAVKKEFETQELQTAINETGDILKTTTSKIRQLIHHNQEEETESKTKTNKSSKRYFKKK